MTREDQFSVVANSLLSYDTGDILLLSDIEDSVSLLKDFFLDQEEAYQLIQRLLNLIRAEMNQAGQHGFVDTLTRGIDLLQELSPGLSPGDTERVHRRMRTFMESGENQELQSSAVNHDDESFQIFLAEAADRLVEAQSLILALEQDFEDLELINKLFRIYHTIKGESEYVNIDDARSLKYFMQISA